VQPSYITPPLNGAKIKSREYREGSVRQACKREQKQALRQVGGHCLPEFIPGHSSKHNVAYTLLLQPLLYYVATTLWLNRGEKSGSKTKNIRTSKNLFLTYCRS
jgi:hypothetical protein